MAEKFKDFLIDFTRVIGDIPYCFLRGYEDFPYEYNNDLDIGVESKESSDIIINNLLNEGFTVQSTRESFGVAMILVKRHSLAVKVDIWYDINFIGLKYTNMENVIKRKNFFHAYPIANFEEDFIISIVKEMLHMRRLRGDKLSRNRLLWDLAKNKGVSAQFLSKEVIIELGNMVEKGIYDPKLRFRIFKEILVINLQNFGFLRTFIRVLTWVRHKI